MKVKIVPIGNSKGIRIPKMLLDQCHIREEVDIEVKGDALLIQPIHKSPREKWKEAFQKMKKHHEDQLLIRDQIDLDTGDWEWT